MNVCEMDGGYVEVCVTEEYVLDVLEQPHLRLAVQAAL